MMPFLFLFPSPSLLVYKRVIVCVCVCVDLLYCYLLKLLISSGKFSFVDSLGFSVWTIMSANRDSFISSFSFCMSLLLFIPPFSG